MPKKSTKAILSKLKKLGIDVGDDLEKVEEGLDDIELSAEESLGSDQIILSRVEWRELKDDLSDKNRKYQKLKEEASELRDAMDAGDSDNVRKASTYKKKLDDLEPLVAKLLGSQTKAWKAAEASIPKELHAEFTFAEKDKELSTDQLLKNTSKFDEYVRIGIIGEKGNGSREGSEAGEVTPADPSAARVGGKQQRTKLTKEQLDELPAASKMEAGYKTREPEGTAT